MVVQKLGVGKSYGRNDYARHRTPHMGKKFDLNMECLDSGMFLFTESPGTKAALQSCYKEAFGKEYDEADVVVLLEE